MFSLRSSCQKQILISPHQRAAHRICTVENCKMHEFRVVRSHVAFLNNWFCHIFTWSSIQNPSPYLRSPWENWILKSQNSELKTFTLNGPCSVIPGSICIIERKNSENIASFCGQITWAGDWVLLAQKTFHAKNMCVYNIWNLQPFPCSFPCKLLPFHKDTYEPENAFEMSVNDARIHYISHEFLCNE